MSALKYWIWLSSLEGVSVRAKAAVIRRFGDAESAFFAPSGVLGETEGVSPTEAAALEQKSLHRADEILGDCEAQNLSIVTMQDALYPKRLRAIWAPPVVLYVKGRLPHIDDEAAIAVVGTRAALMPFWQVPSPRGLHLKHPPADRSAHAPSQLPQQVHRDALRGKA